jgi:hypothetical protein
MVWCSVRNLRGMTTAFVTAYGSRQWRFSWSSSLSVFWSVGINAIRCEESCHQSTFASDIRKDLYRSRCKSWHRPCKMSPTLLKDVFTFERQCCKFRDVWHGLLCERAADHYRRHRFICFCVPSCVRGRRQRLCLLSVSQMNISSDFKPYGSSHSSY